MHENMSLSQSINMRTISRVRPDWVRKYLRPYIIVALGH